MIGILREREEQRVGLYEGEKVIVCVCVDVERRNSRGEIPKGVIWSNLSKSVRHSKKTVTISV